MKRLLYTCIILIAVSCKREPLTIYNTADNVFFNYNLDFNSYRDSMVFSFSNRDVRVQDTILLVPIGVTGVAAAKDRPFKLVVDPTSTALAGTHYELPEPVMHAGKVTDTLRLRFKRAADLASGKKKLVLRLEPNEFFKTDLQYRILSSVARDSVAMLSFSIAASDILDAGPYWTSAYAAYFGTFSIKKVRLIHDLLGMPLDFWTENAFLSNQQKASAIYYASSTSRYLKDEAAQGNIILDEDGTPMMMGPGF